MTAGATGSRPQVRVTFFGDSICVGQGVSIHKGWVTRISARLSVLADELGADVVVTNASVNGNTTRQALERMPYDVQSHGVDVLILQFGMNDCNVWASDGGLPRVSPDAFRANLEEIIRRAVRFGAHTVLLNTNHPTGRDDELLPNTTLTYQAHNARYNQVIREVGEHGDDRVVLNDVEARFEALVGDDPGRLSELLLPDGLHLSEAGHDVYFDAISGVVEASVRRIVAPPPLAGGKPTSFAM